MTFNFNASKQQQHNIWDLFFFLPIDARLKLLLNLAQLWFEDTLINIPKGNLGPMNLLFLLKLKL